jgi:hypothetical protein
MDAAALEYAHSPSLYGNAVPKLWRLTPHRMLFGDLAVVAFLVAQCLDGIFTYVGVTTFGNNIEANPLIGALMLRLGHGTALLVAKSIAASLGIALHLRGVHVAVAALVLFYVATAVLPWIAILFF